jgi:hypothetical protein
MKSTCSIIALAALASTGACFAQSGGPYTLVKSTIDGGGQMWSTGGSYTLGGTIGQFDAGQHSGGVYTCGGGFWGGSGTTACYANCDGSTMPPVLNVADFSCFLSKFAAGNLWANCDSSTTPPVLNVADFSCFLSKFAAGCQ